MVSENTTPDFYNISEAVDWLKQNGYVYEFTLQFDRIQKDNDYQLKPNRFEVDCVCKIKGLDDYFVYGISSYKSRLRGLILVENLSSIMISDEMKEVLKNS